MSMNLAEFKKKMASGEVSGKSKFSMRNEDIQKKAHVNSYNMLKKEQAKLVKLLLIKELAFDFDPTTGSDEEFNRSNKFRPMMSATSCALLVKQAAAEIPETKRRIMERAGVKEWDLTDVHTLTKEDKEIFDYYAYPQIFTLPVFNVKLKALSAKAWGRNYIIDVKRDPETNKIVGDTPFPLQANYWYNGLAQEAYHKIEVAAKDPDNQEVILTDEQLGKKRSALRDQIVQVSSDYPVNYIRCFEIPLTDSIMVDSNKMKLDSMTADKFAESLVLTKLSKELSDAIIKFKSTLKKFDTHFDFYELDMSCPTDTDDPKDLGKGTRYEKPTIQADDADREAEKKSMATLEKLVTEVIDNEGEVEQKVWASTRITKYDDTVEEKLLEALQSELSLTDPNVTDSLIKGNKSFVTRVFGEEGDAAILEAEGGFSERKEGSYNEEQVDKDREEATLDMNTMLEEMDLDNIDLGNDEA